jgi:proteasome lid subunit RPN8/RPN11
MHPARNALASPYRYEVDPRDLVRIVHAVERRGDDLVAIFHSHPGSPAVPSARDVREAAYPVIHVVAGMSDGGVLRAWRIDGTEAYEVPLVVEGSGAGQSNALRRNAATCSRRAVASGQ